MGDLYIKASNWVRPADWLPIDNLVSVGEHRFVALMAIFPDQPNIWVHSSSQAFTVRVAGVATNYAANASARGQISFASVPNSTLTTEGFKQVIIEVFPQVAPWTGSFEITSPGSATPANQRMQNNQYIDVRMSAPNIGNMFMNQGARMVYLRRWTWLGSYQPKSRGLAFNSQYLEEINEDFSNANGSSSLFSVTKLPRVIGNLSFTSINTAQNTFISCWGNETIGNLTFNIATNANPLINGLSDTKTIGNISMPNSTTAFQISNVFALERIGTINIPGATSISIGGANLITIGNITTSGNLSSLNGAFSGNRRMERLHISNCANVTVTTNLIFNCFNLKELFLGGLTRGFTVPPCQMDDAAFAALFNSLGTAAGAQTIVITGNITLTAPTLAIATGKGYTITP